MLTCSLVIFCAEVMLVLPSHDAPILRYTHTYSYPDDEYAVVLLEHSSETGSLLTKQGIDSLWELNAIITAIEVS